MNKRFFSVPLLIIFVCATGCKKEPSANEQIEKVKAETTAAAQDMKDATFAKKPEFVAKMQGQLDALKQDLAQLSDKVESSSESVKAEAKPKLEALRDQASQLNIQLEKVRNASESTWEEVKAGSQKALDTLKGEFQKSKQWVSDKLSH